MSKGEQILFTGWLPSGHLAQDLISKIEKMHLFSFAFCFFKQKSYSSIIAELRDPGIQDPIFFNSLKYNKVNCLSLLALITQWGWTYLILSYLTPLFIVPDGVVDDMQIWSIWDIGCQEAFHDVMGLSHFIYALRKAVRGGNKIFLESAIQRKLSIIMQVMVQGAQQLDQQWINSG